MRGEKIIINDKHKTTSLVMFNDELDGKNAFHVRAGVCLSLNRDKDFQHVGRTVLKLCIKNNDPHTHTLSTFKTITSAAGNIIPHMAIGVST